MPTYEFRCANGHEFEQFHRKISDAPSTVPCPECGVMAERVISGGAGLLFKGSGFYLTDYGKNAHRAGAKADGKKPEGGSSDGGAKSDGSASSAGGAAGGSAGGSAGGGSSTGSSTGSSSPKGDA